jgi:hypothetical protein
MEVDVSAQVKELKNPLAPLKVSLGAGESQNIGWNLSAPVGVDALRYELEAKGSDGTQDRLAVLQKVVPVIPVRIFQATLTQVDKTRC